MREKTSEQIIKIDYSNAEVKAVVDSKLDELNLVNVDPYISSRNHLRRYGKSPFLRPQLKKLELEDFRNIQRSKSKIITNELEKHKVRAWSPAVN